MRQTPRAQSGLTLLEVLLATVIAAILVAPLSLVVRDAVTAQAVAGAVNGVGEQARFAMQRMTAAVRNTPAATVLGAKAADTTGDWLAPVMFCLSGSGKVVETIPADTGCAGSAVIADGATGFSVQTFSAGTGAAPVIEIQLTLAGSEGAAVALTSRTRLGGGTL